MAVPSYFEFIRVDGTNDLLDWAWMRHDLPGLRLHKELYAKINGLLITTPHAPELTLVGCEHVQVAYGRML